MATNKKEIIVDIDAKIKAANAETDLRKLRRQLNELNSELSKIGDTSSEDFIKLSEAISKVEGKIGDAGDRLKTITGEPLERVNAGLSLVSEGLMNLDFDKATIGINGIADGINKLKFADIKEGIGKVATAFYNLGKALLTNPFFLLGSTIALIILNFEKLKNLGGAVGDFFRGLGKVVDGIVKSFKDFTDFLGLTNYALEETTKKAAESTDAMAKFSAAILNTSKSLNQIKGLSTFILDWSAAQSDLNAVMAKFNAEKAKYIGGNNELVKYLDEVSKTTDKYAASIKKSNGELIDGVTFQKQQETIMKGVIDRLSQLMTSEEDRAKLTTIVSEMVSKKLSQAAALYIEDEKQKTENAKKQLQVELDRANLITDADKRQRTIWNIQRKIRLEDAKLDYKLRKSGAEDLIQLSENTNAQFSKDEEFNKKLRRQYLQGKLDDNTKYFNQLLSLTEMYSKTVTTTESRIQGERPPMDIFEAEKMVEILKELGIETVNYNALLNNRIKLSEKDQEIFIKNLKTALQNAQSKKAAEIKSQAESLKDETLYQAANTQITIKGEERRKESQKLYNRNVANINKEFRQNETKATIKKAADTLKVELDTLRAGQAKLLDTSKQGSAEKMDLYDQEEATIILYYQELAKMAESDIESKQLELQLKIELDAVDVKRYNTLVNYNKEVEKNADLKEESDRKERERKLELLRLDEELRKRRINDQLEAAQSEFNVLKSHQETITNFKLKAEKDLILKIKDLRLQANAEAQSEEFKVIDSITADKLKLVVKGSDEEKTIIADGESAKEVVREKYAKKSVEIEQNATDQKLKANEDFAKKAIDLAQYGMDVANELGELANAKDEALRDEQGRLDLAVQERIFNRNKNFQYANAVMNTAAAVTGALAASGGVNWAGAIAAGAAGLIQILKISATKFTPEGGVGGGGGGTVDVKAPDMAEAPKNPFFSQGYMAGISPNGELGFRPGNNQMMLRVGVYENDIRTTMNKVSVLESRSTLSGAGY